VIQFAVQRKEETTMNDLPDKIARFDVLRVEYGYAKMCKCERPHYELDCKNRLVYCKDCGAIVDPFEALVNVATATEQWDDYRQRALEERRKIANYQPRRVVIKKLEKQYVRAEHDCMEPTCPRCGKPFELEELLGTAWVRKDDEK